jgi:hypothetical protein
MTEAAVQTRPTREPQPSASRACAADELPAFTAAEHVLQRIMRM